MAIAPCIDCRIVEKTLWKRLDLRGKGKLFSFVSRPRILLRTCFLASSSAGGSLRLPTGLIKCDITSHIKPGKQNIGSNKASTCPGSILGVRKKDGGAESKPSSIPSALNPSARIEPAHLISPNIAPTVSRSRSSTHLLKYSRPSSACFRISAANSFSSSPTKKFFPRLLRTTQESVR